MMVIDTNVVSEMMKPADRRSAAVVKWLQRQQADLIFTTTITLAEVAAGLLLMPNGRRRAEKELAASRIFSALLTRRVLSFDESAAWAYADVMASRRRHRQSIDPLDLQIAAIARSKSMAVATRNVADFEYTGIEVINPWDA